MQRTLDANRPDKDRSTSVTFDQRERYPHTKLHGGYHDKQPVNVTVEGYRKEIPMFLKSTHDSHDTGSPARVTAEMYFEYWKSLKDAGVPTVPTMRVVSPNEVLMTDMKADGSHFYGKHSTVHGRQSSPLDESFMQIDLLEVTKECQRIVELVNKAGISLPEDSDPFSLLLHPSGKWEVIVLDTTPLYSDVVGEPMTTQQRRAENNKAPKVLLQHLLETRENITKKKTSIYQ